MTKSVDARFNLGLAATIGAISGLVLFAVIGGLSVFDLRTGAAGFDLLLHVLIGAGLFAVGSAVRNHCIA